MFNQITNKFSTILKSLRGLGKINESNIEEAVRDVRRALLDADVNFKVVKKFVNSVKDKAQGVKVLNSIKPGEHFIKIIHDELTFLLGNEDAKLNLNDNFNIILITGLQGAGKTTTAGKLAKFLKDKNFSVLLASVDIYRPSAVDQLNILAQSAGIDFYSDISRKPIEICTKAVEKAKYNNNDVLIVDTAGRNHIDEDMMAEIFEISNAIKPNETIFVSDAMTGQDAVKSAEAFNKKLQLTGIILTKMDGDARGGAALSIKEVTGTPIKFVGNSEKIDGLEKFSPRRMADRILGYGDVLSLVEKAQSVFDEDQSKIIQKKIKNNSFNLNDFKIQITQMKKMGSITDLIRLLPGVNSKVLKNIKMDDRQIGWTEAIINSMTRFERITPESIDGNRRLRISKGSGRPLQEVNSLLKQYFQMKKMMKKMGKINNNKMSNIGNFRQF